jgi:hypothetical protein
MGMSSSGFGLAGTVVLLMACSGGDDDSPARQPWPNEMRSMTEVCEVYCANARAHGCESDITLGSSCQAGCEWMPEGGADCERAWRNHVGCLADVANLCDAEQRDDGCLDRYCAMRHACELPDPRCDR